MLWLIPRLLLQKMLQTLSQQRRHKIEDHHWFAWLCSPSPPQSEDGTPNNTIEYANYLHVNTPRETKSTAQTLYKDTGQGSEDPNPFRQLDVVALRGARVRRMMEMILK